MKTTPLPEILKQITPLPYSPDDGLIRLGEQLELCRANIGTDREWQALTIHDEDGPAGVMALCHPSNAAYLTHAANVLPGLVEAAESIISHLDTPQSARLTNMADLLEDLRKALALATNVPVNS